MSFLEKIKLAVSYSIIVFGAYLYASSSDKYVAKCLLIAGLVSSIYVTVKWVIQHMNRDS